MEISGVKSYVSKIPSAMSNKFMTKSESISNQLNEDNKKSINICIFVFYVS